MDNPFSTIFDRFDRIEKMMTEILQASRLSDPAPFNDQEKEALLTVDEIAIHLNLSKATVWRHVRNGVLPYYKPGKQYLFKKSEVDKAISSSTPIKRRSKGGSSNG